MKSTQKSRWNSTPAALPASRSTEPTGALIQPQCLYCPKATGRRGERTAPDGWKAAGVTHRRVGGRGAARVEDGLFFSVFPSLLSVKTKELRLRVIRPTNQGEGSFPISLLNST